MGTAKGSALCVLALPLAPRSRGAMKTNLRHVAIPVKSGGLVSAFMAALAGSAPGQRLKKFSGDFPYAGTARLECACQRGLAWVLWCAWLGSGIVTVSWEAVRLPWSEGSRLPRNCPTSWDDRGCRPRPPPGHRAS